ncbi:hypothetical protein Ais01nite_46420 [Asanoa ishikariensis]|nr:hypothetical protein Ais01nite_46420 [Asanoa ishikariensis]
MPTGRPSWQSSRASSRACIGVPSEIVLPWLRTRSGPNASKNSLASRVRPQPRAPDVGTATPLQPGRRRGPAQWSSGGRLVNGGMVRVRTHTVRPSGAELGRGSQSTGDHGRRRGQGRLRAPGP